jgi:hypothetical protein
MGQGGDRQGGECNGGPCRSRTYDPLIKNSNTGIIKASRECLSRQECCHGFLVHPRFGGHI